MPNRIASSTAANTSPPGEGVNSYPGAVTAANSATASAGKIHDDFGIGPCALMLDSLQILKTRCGLTMQETTAAVSLLRR